MSDGVPSPNPEFPQPIKNVTGNANVKIQNKNLFDKNNFEYVNGKRLDDNGEVVSDANSSYSITLFEVKPNTTYTIQGTQSEKTKSTRIYYYNNQKQFISRTRPFDTDSYSFTTLENCNYIGLQLRNSEYINVNIIQLEEGSTATSYVPHAEQNYPFTFAEGQRGMQGTTLQDDGIHNIRTHITLDGTENITLSTATVGTSNYGKFDVTISKRANVNDRTALCSHFKYKFQGWTTAGNENTFSFTTATTLRLLLDINEFPTVEALKTYLANNNMTFEFVTEQPEIIPYNSTQQAQYNNIKANSTSYDDITIISSESDELGFDMKAIAVADANKVIESQNNEIDTIKSRLDLLEG